MNVWVRVLTEPEAGRRTAVELDAKAVVGDLVGLFEIDGERAIAIVNGRRRGREEPIREGEEVFVLTPVGEG